MKGLRHLVTKSAAVLLVCAGSLLLLGYASWVRGIDDGSRALTNHDYAAAGRMFEEARARMAHTWLPFGILRSGYRVLVLNQARILSANQKYDDLMKLLSDASAQSPELANDPEYHFWTGIVEYRKSVSQTNKQVLRAGLQRSADAFRLAMVSEPQGQSGVDWDAKYNYEVVSGLLAGMRNKSGETPEKLNRGGMKVLREDPDHPKEQPQKLAPDKQS